MLGSVGGGGKPPIGRFSVRGGGMLVPPVGALPKLSLASRRALAFLMPSGLPLIYYLGMVGVYLGAEGLKRLASRCFRAYENAGLEDFYALVYILGWTFWGSSSSKPISFLLFFIIASRSRFILIRFIYLVLKSINKYKDRTIYLL